MTVVNTETGEVIDLDMERLVHVSECSRGQLLAWLRGWAARAGGSEVA